MSQQVLSVNKVCLKGGCIGLHVQSGYETHVESVLFISAWLVLSRPENNTKFD